MKTPFISAALFLLLATQLAYAADVGRYQAVALPKGEGHGPDEVLILDTSEGHIWSWSEYPSYADGKKGGRFLIYQGKVKPGKKMGDIIEKQEF